MGISFFFVKKGTLLCFLLFVSLASQPATGLSPASTRPATAQQQQAIADIDAFIDSVMATGGTVGMSVSVVRGNETIYAKGFGFADRETGRAVTPDTLFYIASTTKSFTALAGALLAAHVRQHCAREDDLDARRRPPPRRNGNGGL